MTENVEPIEALTYTQAARAGRLTEYRSCRRRALQAGRVQWGCGGSHHGNGAEGCPPERHHHHDAYCGRPGIGETRRAGVTIPTGGWRRRG